MSKYFKIVPINDITTVISESSAEEAMDTFAIRMDTDMNTYFKPVEITKEEYDRLKNEIGEM